MRASSFIEYASSASLSPDEIYTIELLIERVRDEFDPDYGEGWCERGDAREAPGYAPSFAREHIEPATVELKKISWVSFQRLRDAKRPVRDLTALGWLEELTGLVLINNEITDLTPLKNCKKLRKLHLTGNPIHNISTLSTLVNLEELEMEDTPIEDFSPLEALPRLKFLSISAGQVNAFRRLKHLPALEKLEFGLDTFESFDGFPLMPELRVVRGAHVESLSGLQRYPKIENLVNLSGTFDSLEPLRELKRLTHANIHCSVQSLQPLARLLALRELWLGTDARELDLTPLEGLPSLHEVTIKCADEEPPALEKLRAELSSWDLEFQSEKPRHVPSLELEVVDQDTFDYYDTKKRFGLSESDANEGLMSSELEWLDRRIEEVFAVDFKKEEDYVIPFQWGGARSRTVVLLSERAIEAFPRLVLGIQHVLCTTHKDWIIYFQSDSDDFVVWIYPQKVQVTEKHAETVRSLIEPR